MQSMSKSLRLISLIFTLVLGACSERDTAPEKSRDQLKVQQLLRSLAQQDAPLLAAKYHMSPQVAEEIIVDAVSKYIGVQAMTSPAPKSETMTQTIERLSTTYQVKPDVVASLIVDELVFSDLAELGMPLPTSEAQRVP